MIRIYKFTAPGLAALAAIALPAFGASSAAAQSVAAVAIGTFDSPVYVTAAAGYAKLLFVVERAGRVRVMRNDKTLGKPFLDIRDIVYGDPDPGAFGEQGLLSIAFPPNYKKTRRFYVAFTNAKGDIEVDEFLRAKRGGTRAIAKSRRVLLTIRHRDAPNHNGGQLQFGPDGLLYIGTGDGGGGGDQFDNARKTNRLLGKILRINPRPRKNKAYRIPKSNPFVGKPGRDEIFAYGVRNPWRFSFNGSHLMIADVGQDTWEEIDSVPLAAARGANFGWPQYEGNAIFDNARPGPGTPTFPVFVYEHSGGRCSITGGYVVTDATIPAMNGRYLYGDYCTGEVRSVVAANGSDDQPAGLTLSGLASFGEGYKGQIYAVQVGGTVSRIEAPVPTDTN